MRGLPARLAASYIALAVLVLLSAGLISHLILSRYLQQQDQAVIDSRLDAAARAVGLALAYQPDARPDAILAEVSPTSPGIGVARESTAAYLPGVVSTGPSVVLETGELRSGGLVRVILHSPPDRPLDRVVIVQENDRVRSAVRVTWAEPAEQTAALWRGLLGAGILALTAAGLMALWFSRTLTAPLHRMAEATGRLADGQWETPLPENGPSEVLQLSEAFRTMARRLQGDFQSLHADRERLQGLAAEIAHEIKTPIAALRTYHELLLDGEQENPQTRQQLLEWGATQVTRLEYLANFLVDMARLEAHTAPLERKEADLAGLVRRTVAAMLPRAEAAGVELVTALPGRPLPALVSPQRVGQALDNLLQNAIAWSPSGGRVFVTVSALADAAEITVTDQGPGIQPDLLPKLFEPFVKGEGSKGLGIGLAVVRAVAQSHGGSVAAGAGPEGGASFTIRLPMGCPPSL